MSDATSTPPAETAAPAQEAIMANPAAGTSDRAGGPAEAYGSPYDAARQPWPVYSDPAASGRAQTATREAEQRRKAQAGSGTEFVFRGHIDPYNGTSQLVTEAGTVGVGGRVKLNKEAVTRLRAGGWVFEDPAEAEDRRKAAQKRQSKAQEKGGDK